MNQYQTNNRRWTKFTLAAIAIAVVVFVGFAKNYYLRVWLGTRPITAMVHVHGVVMTTWVALFLTQTLLVAKRRVDLHRKLGVGGAILAGVIVVLGIYTIAASIERHNPGLGAELSAKLFVAFDGVSLLLFGGLVAAALQCRQHPQIHRHLMLMAMISLLPPAFGRLVAYFIHQNGEIVVLGLMYSSVLLCVLIDRLRHHRFDPALASAGVLIVAVNQMTYFAQVAA